MNVRLTENDYQHMLMELIASSIERIEDLRQSDNEAMVDWIYFIERLKIKGVLNDLKLVRPQTPSRALMAAKVLRRQFVDENSDKNITTQI